MAQLRAYWQGFKKAHPRFEKSKNFKYDVGPQLDEYEKLGLSILKQINSIEPRLKALDSKQDVLDDAWVRYTKVVSDLAADDRSPETKAMLKDLEILQTRIDNRIDRAEKKRTIVGKQLKSAKLA